MSTKKNKLVKMLREIIKREVQKEVKKIFISEGMKVPSNKIVNDVPEVLPKPKNREEVSYTKNPMLNKDGDSCGFCGKTPDQFSDCNEPQHS